MLGGLIGGFSGLMPGMHPNTLAALIAISPFMALIMPLVPNELEYSNIIIFGSFLISILLAHSLTEMIPTAFMGIPNDDTIVALLPSQRLFASGRWDLLIECTMVGSLGAVILFAIIFIPICGIMGGPFELYRSIKGFFAIILIGIAILVIVSAGRARRILSSAAIFLLSGIFGLVVLTLSIPQSITELIPSDIWVNDSSCFLLPAFSGFFSVPSLILMKKKKQSPKFIAQSQEEVEVPRLTSLLRSILPSTLVGWIPGITNAYATTLSFIGLRMKSSSLASACRYLVTYSATNVGGSLHSIIAFFVIGRARNGIIESINDQIGQMDVLPFEIIQPPMMLLCFLWSACIGAVVGALILRTIGSWILQNNRFEFGRYVRIGIIVFIMSLVIAISGPAGLLVLFTSVVLAVLTINMCVSRIHLMGFILFPVIVHFMSMLNR